MNAQRVAVVNWPRSLTATFKHAVPASRKLKHVVFDIRNYLKGLEPTQLQFCLQYTPTFYALVYFHLLLSPSMEPSGDSRDQSISFL